MLPWTEKYKPKSTKEIIGQEQTLAKIKSNLKKPLLLYGKTGTGKTSTVHIIAKELNYEILEINSSEKRNKDAIIDIIGNAINQQSLFYKGKVILIDDIDAISGTKDRGCIQSITKIMDSSKYPIIFTCTDPWIDKLSDIRKKTMSIEFQQIPSIKIAKRLKEIAELESFQYNEEDILKLAKKAKGDMRAAINDLQTNVNNNQLILEQDSERDKKEDVIFCLRRIFKEKDFLETNNIFNKTDLNFDEIFLWIDENLPKEYDAEELIPAYECLSRADIFKGRIRRWQYWRFLVYINTFLTSGISISKKGNKSTLANYTRTTRILKMWQANIRNAKKKAISEKIAFVTHTSKKRALQDTYPYIKNLLHNKEISAELNLGEDEISWINKHR
ncbi:MAG: replication factor C large subunit [archaeon]